MLRMLDLVMWSYYDTNACHFNNNVTPNVLARTFSMMNLTAMMQLQQQAVKIRRLVVLRDWLLYSADARARVRQRDRHHTAHVRAPCHLPEQDERPQRLFPHAPHSSAAEAAHAGVLPDDLVTQQRHRHAGGDPLELNAHVCVTTRNSAIAEGPRDASCQLKSCQLQRNIAETTCTTSPEQIEVMKLKGYSGPTCNKHVHSTITRSSGFHCLIGVINKPTTVELCISPVHRLLAVAKFSMSTMYKLLTWLWPRPPRKHSLITRLRHRMANSVQNLTSLGSPGTKLWMAVQNAENGVIWGS